MAPRESDPAHRQRQMAESFGVDADRYDRARMAYPDELITRITELSSGPDVLDVGCGTGIEARQLQAVGASVLGVEPDARMAAYARSRGLVVEESRFEDWDAAGRTYDAVVAAQAWHWVDPVAGATKVRELLRPGGLFAAFWNVYEPPAPIGDALLEGLKAVVPDLPLGLGAMKQADRTYEEGARQVGERFVELGGFAEPEPWRFSWSRDITREEWLDFVPTQGFLTQLSGEQCAPVLEVVGAAIDDLGGTFTLNTVTVGVAVPFRQVP
ncbi:class I SAM-dependent methyltransferase [Nocardioides sp. NPDC051685]|uniref:class I SAM-dependent methyltransferase n=1 Tax=Nocardioides sp. NPDC051685 TaxID=3364334 RepID=UPI00378ADF4E